VRSFHRYFLKLLNDAVSLQFPKQLPAPLIDSRILLHRRRSRYPRIGCLESRLQAVFFFS